MPTLLLDFSGPMQSWGSDSRFVHRETRMLPTKSGVIGLLAAAQGRRRNEEIEDLLALRFGVRQEQAGTLMSDFQTAIDWRSGKSMPLSYRSYLADARFLIGLEAEQSLLEGLADAIASPVFPVYLGRRSCPPSRRLVIGIRDEPLHVVLANEQWRAADWYRRKQAKEVMLLWSRDASPGEKRDETLRDSPRSFDPRHRDYGWRDVVHGWAKVKNEQGREQRSHDEFALVGGA